VCRSPDLLAIHTMLAARASFAQVSAAMRTKGTAMKPTTVAAHFHQCLDNVYPDITDVQLQRVQDMRGDFAVLVQKKAMQLLETGNLRVTATHGLQAQALLDRRAEKAADRDLAVNLARLLSGAMAPTPMKVVSGEGYDIMLAPPRIVSD
jgi:hypothetical protein